MKGPSGIEKNYMRHLEKGIVLDVAITLGETFLKLYYKEALEIENITILYSVEFTIRV